ncbi:DUF934 domain-containing protein [Hydrogenophaga sp. 5NK40-0174]|uniref:DUF934 domain-containing protein n=1 Tax=Hydrogenophaga sp. 5NK40-0174 TaxID=3127649 RepID=UPI0031026F75
MTNSTLTLFRQDTFEPAEPQAERLVLANDADPRDSSLEGITVVELQFPKFSDGRAFSQAFLLRRRLGFKGSIRAIGDVLVDQLPQMARTGFSEAVLRADQDLSVGARQIERYASHYQGDAVRATPRFVELA